MHTKQDSDRLANNVDPDQTVTIPSASGAVWCGLEEQSDLGLHCLPRVLPVWKIRIMMICFFPPQSLICLYIQHAVKVLKIHTLKNCCNYPKIGTIILLQSNESKCRQNSKQGRPWPECSSGRHCLPRPVCPKTYTTVIRKQKVNLIN